MTTYELRIFAGPTEPRTLTDPDRREGFNADSDKAAIEYMNRAEATLRKRESVYLVPAGAEHSIASGSGCL